MSTKENKKSTEETTATVATTTEKINLSDFVTATSSTGSKTSNKAEGSSNRESSAYSMLKSEKMQVKNILENGVKITPIKHYRFINGTFLLSNNNVINSKNMSVEVLSKLADGTQQSDEVIVFKGETDTATDIYNLFMNKETAPSTKCHGKWFGLDENNIPVFVSLQGDSIKICR